MVSETSSLELKDRKKIKSLGGEAIFLNFKEKHKSYINVQFISNHSFFCVSCVKILLLMNRSFPIFQTLLVLFSLDGYGQGNLILNGDFEEYWECPDDETQLQRCKHVNNPCYHDPPAWSSTSDYFNVCSNSSLVSVPNNFPGYQNPRSGSGYTGLIIWKTNDSNYYNEYIQLEFSEVLKAGAAYKFQIYANLGNTMEYTTKNIQFKLASANLTYSTFLDQLFEPDYRSDTLISDTLNWVPINFEFTASGNEKYIIIGNFDSPAMTDFTFLYDLPNMNNPNFSYFYFDDASLVSLKDTDPISVSNIFTPNNDGINDVWQFDSPLKAQLAIFNRWGNLVYESSGNSLSWDGANYTDGIYYYQLSNEDSLKTGFIQLIR